MKITVLSRTLVVALAIISATVLSAQNSQITVQEIRIERAVQPGDFISLTPPNATITPYTMVWPPEPPATSGLALMATGTGPYQLIWGVPTGMSFEIVSSTNGNLRRVGPLNEGGITGTPGAWSNDFQGSRTNPSQTASGNYSLIAGGRNNTASGDYSLVLGGMGNTASGAKASVVGGENNTASGTGSAVLGGLSNSSGGQNSGIGGGQGNSVTSTGTNSFVGGGQNNTISGGNSFIGGGASNLASGMYTVIGGGANNKATDTAAVVGGGSNNTASGKRSAIGGGNNNSVSGEYSFIGAGDGNSVSGVASAIGGGDDNEISGDYAVIGGGRDNNNGQDYGVIGGGEDNVMSTGTHSSITGGNNNNITGSYSFIGGGQNNTIGSDYAAIPGGQAMTLASGADGSFGFNGKNSAMSVSAAASFVIANADLWLANNDGTQRQLRFYESYGSTGSFPGVANYVALQAPSSMSANNTYTLPSSIGKTGQVLSIASGATSSSATLEWTTVVNSVVNTVNVTADDQAITAAQLDGITFLRLSSNNGPANRTVTLANGAYDGLRLIIRCVATGTNGVEIVNGGNMAMTANVQLQNQDTITLLWDSTQSVWIELFRSDN